MKILERSLSERLGETEGGDTGSPAALCNYCGSCCIVTIFRQTVTQMDLTARDSQSRGPDRVEGQGCHGMSRKGSFRERTRGDGCVGAWSIYLEGLVVRSRKKIWTKIKSYQLERRFWFNILEGSWHIIILKWRWYSVSLPFTQWHRRTTDVCVCSVWVCSLI